MDSSHSNENVDTNGAAAFSSLNKNVTELSQDLGGSPVTQKRSHEEQEEAAVVRHVPIKLNCPNLIN